MSTDQQTIHKTKIDQLINLQHIREQNIAPTKKTNCSTHQKEKKIKPFFDHLHFSYIKRSFTSIIFSPRVLFLSFPID